MSRKSKSKSKSKNEWEMIGNPILHYDSSTERFSALVLQRDSSGGKYLTLRRGKKGEKSVKTVTMKLNDMELCYLRYLIEKSLE